MQSIFRLTWCADQIAPKMQTGKAALDSMRASPVMEMPMLNKLKRKRTDSPEPSPQFRLRPIKKQRGESDALSTVTRVPIKSERETTAEESLNRKGSHEVRPRDHERQAPVTHASASRDQIQQTVITPFKHIQTTSSQATARQGMVDDVQMSGVSAHAQDETASLTALQQVIENEFNLQILMKHNELRLIEQELAKCQVALEQLRRCELRPFPGDERPSWSVSSGTGASVASPPGHTQPTYAAPHGVADGPYTSYFRQWLLHDPQFDSVAQASPTADTPLHADSRATRHAGTARKSVQKSFSVPGVAVEASRPPPTYPPLPRKHKLAIVKRSTDGQLVKLVCNHCHRSDFSNSQGFLNHCRIAHKVEYKSHDHAAIDCGQPLEEHELASVPPEAHAAPAPKPSASRSASTSSTPFKAHTFVHPMNATGSPSSGFSSSPTSYTPQRGPQSAPRAGPTAKSAAPPKSTSQAPRLSAQFAKYNLGGNLEEVIASAREKVDLGAEEERSPDLESASPLTPATTGARTAFSLPRAGSLAPPGGIARPPSRKGYRQPASRPRPSPLVPSSANAGAVIKDEQQDGVEIPESPHRRSLNLSPSTLDGNPGLVSDHEDDDHGSASEDEVPQTAIAHSLGVRGRDCTDSMDIDVSVDDDMDEHGVIIRRNSMLVAQDRGLRNAGSPSGKV